MRPRGLHCAVTASPEALPRSASHRIPAASALQKPSCHLAHRYSCYYVFPVVHRAAASSIVAWNSCPEHLRFLFWLLFYTQADGADFIIYFLPALSVATPTLFSPHCPRVVSTRHRVRQNTVPALKLALAAVTGE